MRLSDLRNQNRNAQRNQTPGGGGILSTQDGSIRHAVAYTTPISAYLDGQPVTLLATGEIAGMSPACQFVDTDGKIDWASTDDFVVNDRSVVPQTIEQQQKLQQGLRGIGQR